MPCSDSRDYGCDEDIKRRQSAERATCNIVKTLRENGSFDGIFKEFSEDTQLWILGHDEDDRVRELKEAEKRRAEAIRREALNKLSDQDKAALRISS